LLCESYAIVEVERICPSPLLLLRVFGNSQAKRLAKSDDLLQAYLEKMLLVTGVKKVFEFTKAKGVRMSPLDSACPSIEHKYSQVNYNNC